MCHTEVTSCRPIIAIPLPLAHVGSVNAWLLPGDPVTLIDTGPREARAEAALEAGLQREGLRVEDIELVLATHHHLDHVGLAATIQRRAGARVAVLDRVADYARRYAHEVEQDRRFARALMAHHGVPEQVVDDSEDFWDFIRATTEDFSADVRLADGDRVRAGGRSLRVVARPGHSTTDTLFVDDRDRARLRRRPPAGRDLLEHRDPSAGPGAGRPARARACAISTASSARRRCR